MNANLFTVELGPGSTRPGYAHLEGQLRPLLPPVGWGGTLYELRPGERVCPYHWELGCEEFLVVVSGAPTLRTPEGERVLVSGDLVAFPEGEAGAHQLRNDSDEPFRVLIASTKSDLHVCGYPDSGKLLIDAPAHGIRKMLRDAREVDYWDGE